MTKVKINEIAKRNRFALHKVQAQNTNPIVYIVVSWLILLK